MKRIITAALIGVALSATPTAADGPKPRPNILFIMADDHARQAIGSYGSTLIQTPNIDRLAREGVLFRNAFVTNSICAPSRAVFLTGKYSHVNGLRDNRDQFDGSQTTFPKLLQAAGYQTAIVGKWHLKTVIPTGFEHWKVLSRPACTTIPVFLDNATEVRHDGYVTDLDHRLRPRVPRGTATRAGRSCSWSTATWRRTATGCRRCRHHLTIYDDRDLPRASDLLGRL